MIDNFDLHTLFLNHLETGELGEDPLALSSQYIQGLDQKQAMEELSSLKDVRDFTAFYLGGILSLVREHLWYQHLGYSGFIEFVEDYVGISSSTAYDYMHIYKGLSESGILWKKVKHIGWTKVRLFARYLTTDNTDEWCTVAEQRNANQLRDYVKQVLEQEYDKLSVPNLLLSTHADNAQSKAEKVSTHAETSTTDCSDNGDIDQGGVSENAHLDETPPLVTTYTTCGELYSDWSNATICSRYGCEM